MEEKTKNPEGINSHVMLTLRNIIEAAKVCRSVRRAARRGRLTQFGTLVQRPFNNRANTSTRKNVHSRLDWRQKRIDYAYAKRHAA